MSDQPWISPYSGGAKVSTFNTAANTGSMWAGLEYASRLKLSAPSYQPLMLAYNALQPTPESPLITIYKPDSSPQQDLAKILRNGTVVLSYPGAEEEAAKVFWRAVEFCGVSYVKRIRELEDRLAKYETVDRFVP